MHGLRGFWQLPATTEKPRIVIMIATVRGSNSGGLGLPKSYFLCRALPLIASAFLNVGVLFRR